MMQVNDGGVTNDHLCFMNFDAVILSGDLIPLTLPLVQATWPVVEMTSWRNYVEFFNNPAASQESGIVGLRDSAGCFCGLFAYRLDMELIFGRVLAVHFFTAVDVANSPSTIRALLDTTETRAQELNCAAVRIRLCNGQDELASRLCTLGLESETGQFWKKVDHRTLTN
jgi:hypothetical protein